MARSKRTNNRRTTRRLSYETFESRQLMAVTTSLNGGTLTITGDTDADDVAIVGTANPGEIQVIGRNGTEVDGVADGTTTIQGVLADLIADFDDGNNVVNVDNVYLAGQLRLETGSGNDRVVFGATGVVSSVGSCNVDTNLGDDEFYAVDYKVFIADQLTVSVGGRGNDFAQLIGASALTSIEVHGGSVQLDRTVLLLRGVTSGGRLIVSAASQVNNVAVFTSAASGPLDVLVYDGQNSIYVDTCYSAQAITVTAFRSNLGFFPRPPIPGPITPSFNNDDTVTVARCQTPALAIRTGGVGNEYPTYTGGNDTVQVYGNYVVGQGANALSVGTGDGHDNVSASYNVVLGGAFFSLAQLDDTLTLAGNLVVGFASGSGGTGGNLLNLFGNQFGGSSFTEFQ